MTITVIILISFFVGSIPTGILVGRYYGIDPREFGSKNIGATNLNRVLGKKAGLLTLLGDFLKGIVAVQIPLIIGLENPELIMPVTGLFAIFGHCFSPFLKFRGGKGVATSFGVLVILALIPSVLGFVSFIGIVFLSGYVSIASIVAATVVPALIFVNYPQNYNYQTLVVSMICAVLITFRHKENIKRLVSGTETKFNLRK